MIASMLGTVFEIAIRKLSSGSNQDRVFVRWQLISKSRIQMSRSLRIESKFDCLFFFFKSAYSFSVDNQNFCHVRDLN
jgi:hypothetical protein